MNAQIKVVEDCPDAALAAVLASDEAVSELIGCAVSCSERRECADSAGRRFVIEADTTGQNLVALFRNRDWIAFGQMLERDVQRLARREAERRSWA